MQNDWILDVLSDLGAFAKLNGLSALADQLEDTAIVALAEISALEESTGRHAHGTNTETGTDTGGARTSRHA